MAGNAAFCITPLLVFLLVLPISAQLQGRSVSRRPFWTQIQKDPRRTNTNYEETFFTSDNVRAYFGRRAVFPQLDGQVLGQPLYVPAVRTKIGVVDLVIVATQNNTVYGLNAANLTIAWATHILPSVPWGPDFITCPNIAPQYGIVATPYINLEKKLVYVIPKYLAASDRYPHRLYALSIETGAVVDRSDDVEAYERDQVFESNIQMARAGLVMHNNIIYAAFGSHCDRGLYHGWLFGFNTSEPGFPIVKVFLTSPDTSVLKGANAIWMAGAGPAIRNGFMYLAVGNGHFDENVTKHENWGNAILKLNLMTPKLQVADYFVPTNWYSLSMTDSDQGAGGPVLYTIGKQEFVAQIGKSHTVFLLKTSKLGKYCKPSKCSGRKFNANAYEVMRGIGRSSTGVTPAMWRSPDWGPTLFFHPLGKDSRLGMQRVTFDKSGRVKNYTVGPALTSIGAPLGVSPVVTTNGGRNAIVWEISRGLYDSAMGFSVGLFPVLNAYDARTLQPIYSSRRLMENVMGMPTKHLTFSMPTVVDGRAFITFGYSNIFNGQGGIAMFSLILPRGCNGTSQDPDCPQLRAPLRSP